MRISIEVKKQSPVHTTIAVFVNGAYSGSLVLRNEEVREFRTIISAVAEEDEIIIE